MLGLCTVASPRRSVAVAFRLRLEFGIEFATMWALALT